MKKIILTLIAATVAVSMASAQGRVNFQNQTTFQPADAITVGALNMGPAGGNTGWGIGGDKYSVQLLWAPGVIGSQAAFDAASPLSSAVFTGPSVFLANTGDLSTFSGFFDAGTVQMGGGHPAGTYTFQVLAWYNAGNPTYAAAVGAGANVGKSQLFQVAVTVPNAPANTTVFAGFTVNAVPEPSTLALAGLGAAAMLIFRRRK